MSLKYDFNISQGNNIFLDALVYVNGESSGLPVYFMVLIVGFVSLWVFNRNLDDMLLSFEYALFVCIVMGLLFYYTGLFLGASLFSGFLLVGLILLFSGLGGVLWYGRNKTGGD